MNDEVSRIYRYTFIGKANSKFFLRKVCIVTRCSCQCKLLQIPKVLCLRHAVVFFLSSENAFRSNLTIFKCALAIWLRSLTVEISYVSSTGELVSFAVKTGNGLTFYEMHRREKLR